MERARKTNEPNQSLTMYCCEVNIGRLCKSKPYLHSACNAQARGMKCACASDGSQVQHRLHAHAPGSAMLLVPTAMPNPAFDCVITCNVEDTWFFWFMNFLIFWMHWLHSASAPHAKAHSVSLWRSCCRCRACASCFEDSALVYKLYVQK